MMQQILELEKLYVSLHSFSVATGAKTPREALAYRRNDFNAVRPTE
jgi:hypothetical protein